MKIVIYKSIKEKYQKLDMIRSLVTNNVIKFRSPLAFYMDYVLHRALSGLPPLLEHYLESLGDRDASYRGDIEITRLVDSPSQKRNACW